MRGRRRHGFFVLLLSLASGTSAAQPWGAAPVAPAALDVTTRIARSDADLAAAHLRSETAKAEEARAKAEIEALESRAELASRTMRDRVRALYRIRRAGSLPVAGGFEALLSHLARVERLERIVRADVDAVRYLGERRAALEAEVDRARRAREAAERDEATLREARAALELEHGNFLYAPQGVFPTLPVAPLPDESAFGALGVSGVTGVAPLPAAGFAALRGRLGTPVRAYGAIRDAVRDDGPGIELVSPAGTPVLAAAEGRVAFARTYGSYGRVVILDHGSGFYTVYGGLGRIDVRVGDPVGTGATLATVGAAQEPALFFEVRQGTRSLDARDWLGLR